ncbi:conserved hypothetical protein [Thermosulfidibacter takaii ABI70S6]|uniref:tRNA (guanine-N(1)-)-methyltransferase C-terminal domain-containing protein n=1 Tax=Thermosulfidibacter takaii (strain DSM 17441 / JCM 13301 / NBRC 103674 / ABI70S6) TaxID=1298851 RepID=A0A0S3QS81_THET7|nr:RNA methyltransferase [Thermosulfidibacter takaii]BAT71199.1 conserved hypothetical protein [Thermosulfidibacter takaii ABI70S6]
MESKVRLYLVLVHYPVYNKRGKIVASSITNLDIHDLSRLVRTYEGKGLIMVTPLKSQQAMIERITSHWKSGFGAVYNPNRDEALKLVSVAPFLEDAIKFIEEKEKQHPILVATSARKLKGNRISYKELGKKILEGKEPYAIVLGTGWGLTEEVIEKCDYVLDPIEGLGNYNHLSVRCAAAIIVDRLMGWRDKDER